MYVSLLPPRTQRVLCPPVDFRQEKEGGRGATMSASFYLPRAANMLRVIGAMVPTDEVGDPECVWDSSFEEQSLPAAFLFGREGGCFCHFSVDGSGHRGVNS